MDIPDQDMLSWATKQADIPADLASPLLTRILAYTP
jgi:succinate dehydrogenase flavin-adding protein (antitoxin of CptAB toxin-antitoxin module)